MDDLVKKMKAAIENMQFLDREDWDEESDTVKPVTLRKFVDHTHVRDDADRLFSDVAAVAAKVAADRIAALEAEVSTAKYSGRQEGLKQAVELARTVAQRLRGAREFDAANGARDVLDEIVEMVV